MRHSLPALIACAALVAAGCGGSKKTYVSVQILPGATTPAGIKTLRVHLSLSDKPADATLTEPGGSDITFPTSASFEIRSGAGALTVTVSAEDATGKEIDLGTGQGTVSAGQTASIDVHMQGGVAQVKADKTTQAFGTVGVGSSSATFGFTVSNPGPVATGTITLSLSLGANSAYRLVADQCSGKPVPAGGTCTFGVQLSPSSSGTKTDTLTISATPGGSAMIALTGNAVPVFTVTLTKAGTGSGTVKTADGQIICGAGCTTASATYLQGAIVGVTWVADPGSVFSAFSGDCTGASCSLTIDGPKNVTATFTAQYVVTVTKPSITGATITGRVGVTTVFTCTSVSPGTTCSGTFDSGVNATLTASTDSTARFTGWGGDCLPSGASTTCSFNPITANHTNITASFVRIFSLTATVSGSGSGSVTSSPAGINCPATSCSTSYDTGTSVTLTATPDSTTRTVWGGDCASAGGALTGVQTTCTLAMTAVRSASVTFTRTTAISIVKNGPINATVTSIPSGLVCDPTCSTKAFNFDQGSSVTLQARPVNGSGVLFQRWGGIACAGSTVHDCTFTVTAAGTIGVNLGNQTFNSVFVSSTTFAPSLGSARNYDIQCNQLATAAGINNSAGNAFFAWMSDATSNAGALLGAARGFARLDGAPFADQAIDITTNGRLWNPINMDETGAVVASGTLTWTGTGADGTVRTGQTCTNWTGSPDSGPLGGNTYGGPSTWSAWAGFNPSLCSSLKLRLYCIEKDKTVTLTISPVGGKLIFLSPPFAIPVGGGIGAANTHCQRNGPTGSTSTFKALLATSSASAATNAGLVAGTTYVTKDGVVVGTGAEISAGNLRTGAWERADGTFPINGAIVWSGASAPNVAAASTADTCTDWTSTAGTARIGVGTTVDTFFGWSTITDPCTAGADSIYCVEQ